MHGSPPMCVWYCTKKTTVYCKKGSRINFEYYAYIYIQQLIETVLKPINDWDATGCY